MMLTVVLLGLAAPPPPTLAATPYVDAVRAEAAKIVPGLLKTYEWMHAHPEVSGQEVETAKRMSQELKKLGMEVHDKIGGTGIVAVLAGKKAGKGPVVLVRADMDALPVAENTGLPYRSTKPGVMHACGHDIHMTDALGAFAILNALASRWSGTVVAVIQPAEETGRGAAAMLADPRFAQVLAKTGKPQLALAIHDSWDLAGTAWFHPGYSSANVDSVEIVVHGKGGHGAHPERTIDPIVIGASIIVELQSIVARRTKPGELAVITVGKFEGGTKHNIIPPVARLLLTVRSYGDEMRDFLLEEIKRVAVHVARAHAAPQDPEVNVDPVSVPSTYNDPAWTEHLRQLFVAAIGPERVFVEDEKSGGGEDFGRFPKDLGIPGVMYNLGATPKAIYDARGAANVPGLHSPEFAPDPKATLETGIALLALAVLEGLMTLPAQ
ncbi:MAG: amidohydrolase [Deltaproteobacteria bacterium]|nr:amidohydrolase [Deltaproteobacteria bacterium]